MPNIKNQNIGTLMYIFQSEPNQLQLVLLRKVQSIPIGPILYELSKPTPWGFDKILNYNNETLRFKHNNYVFV